MENSLKFSLAQSYTRRIDFSSRFRKYFFKNQSCGKPERSIVEPDDSSVLKTGSGVIPWTDADFSEKTAAYEFDHIKSQHIEKSAADERQGGDPCIQRSDDGSTAVDREHEKRTFACHCPLAGQKGVKPGPENLHAPSNRAAEKKVCQILVHKKLLSKKFAYR